MTRVKIRRLLISAGAMKAGTSWLYKQLEQHAQIETVPVKEVHYFAHVHTQLGFLDDNARIHNYKIYARTCDEGRGMAEIARDAGFFRRYLADPINNEWYENLFTSRTRIVKADFSNMACVLDTTAMMHMKQIAKNLRVIYTLRDPLSRLWSHVKFHAGIMGDLDKLGRFSPDDFLKYFFHSGATGQSDYATNITKMRQHFDASTMKIFYFEDFMSEPRRALNELFEFVGVSPQRYERTALQVIHNEGPKRDCPPAFYQAAAKLLLPQEAALREIGVAPHPNWTYVAQLQAHTNSARAEPIEAMNNAW